MYVQHTLPDNNLINFQLKKLVSINFKNICFFIHHLVYEKEARYIKWEFNVRVNKTNKTCYRAKWTHKKHKLCFCILNISLLQMRAIWICIKTEWERIEREVENFCLSQQCHHTIFFCVSFFSKCKIEDDGQKQKRTTTTTMRMKCVQCLLLSFQLLLLRCILR